ncbi:MAG: carboxypeptidase regulatory-like domain-containing protein [Dokdonella sp.]
MSTTKTCVLIALVSLAAAAQTVTSSINGALVDSSGAAIPGAACTLTARDTGAVLRSQSGTDGSFVFNSVPAGAYTLKAEASGFQALEMTDLRVTISEVRALGRLKLNVGAVSEKLNVVAEAGAVQLSSSEKSGVLTSAQIDQIAVKGRDFMGLLATIPGVIDTKTDSRDASSLSAASGIFINGGGQNSKSVTVDGHNILDIGNNTDLQFQPNMDSIAEIKVLTSNYQASFGRNSSGVISVITKSGTQGFHGSGYYFFRNEGLNANDFFRNRTGTPNPPYRYNTSGFSVGGPVYIPNKFNTNKDKLFFFVSSEFVRRREDYGTLFVNTPTAPERKGDFSQSFDVNGQLTQVKDPLTGSPFPGNIVPANRIDAIGQGILNFFPLPNYTDPTPSLRYQRNYRSGYSGGHPRNDTLVRLDANFWPSFRFYYRFIDDTESQTTPFGIWQAGSTNFNLNPPLAFSHPSTSHLFSATKIFSPTLIGEFSFNTTMTEYIFDRAVDRSTMGNPPRWFTADPKVANYIPDIAFGAQPVNPIAAGLGNAPFYNYIKPYVFSGGVTKVWNAHNVQAGLYVERGRQYMGALFNGPSGGPQNRGVFNFARNVNNPFDTGNAFSNALIGTFNSYTESTSRPDANYIFWNVEWYLQDTWKVTPRLTLDLGVRFYHQPPEFDGLGHLVAFVPGLFDPKKAPALYAPGRNAIGLRVAVDPLTGAFADQTLIGKFVPGAGDPANGMAIAGKNGNPAGGYAWSWLNVTPRAGFAYDLFGDGKTAIRGGFGSYVDRASGNLTYFSGPPIVFVPTQFYGQLSTLRASSGVLSPTSVTSLTASGPMKHPTTMSFSFGIQHRVKSAVVEVSYVGSLARHGIVSKEINPIPLFSRFAPANADPTSPGTPLQDNFLRPLKGWGSITSEPTPATSNYHSLQVSANRRFTRNLQFGAAYTFSKVLAVAPLQGSDGLSNAVTPYFNIRDFNYGLMPWDRTHALNLNYLYALPALGTRLGVQPARLLLNGWELSGMTTFSSGAPFTPGFTTTDGQDITGSAQGATITVAGDPNLSNGDRTFARNFATEAFARTPKGSFGNAGIGLLRGPGTNNWDISLGKKIPLFSEQRFLRFRAEFFNAWNHTQFSALASTARFDPTGKQIDANFGAYSAARRPRIIQLSLRAVF